MDQLVFNVLEPSVEFKAHFFLGGADALFITRPKFVAFWSTAASEK